ncbi:hypothetical protein AAFC00_001761 [Neodothiora populina]|uniref:Dehydrin n=1 Tax=Neodothiora populina TaxID=2781224 RepID=A0ABR3PQA3_9PEZI
MAENMHSTGRGGAGNIGKDDSTLYTDGGIIREGVEGKSNKPEYSSGRGGMGNIVDNPDVSSKPSEDVVPEPAMRPAHQENFHTGRGGEGNVHKEKYGGHSHAHKESIGDKVKHMLHMDKEKEHDAAEKTT